MAEHPTIGKHIVVTWGEMPMMYINATTYTDEEVSELVNDVIAPGLPQGGTVTVEDCDQCGQERDPHA